MTLIIEQSIIYLNDLENLKKSVKINENPNLILTLKQFNFKGGNRCFLKKTIKFNVVYIKRYVFDVSIYPNFMLF